MNSEDEEITRADFVKKNNNNNSKSDYKVRSWSLKRKKLRDSKDKLVLHEKNDSDDQNDEQNQNNNQKDNHKDNDNNKKTDKNNQKYDNKNKDNNNKQVKQDNDFEMELHAKLKERVRSNTLYSPKVSVSEENLIFKKKKSEDDLHVKISGSNSSTTTANPSPPNSPQLRTWATRTRTAYTPRNSN